MDGLALHAGEVYWVIEGANNAMVTARMSARASLGMSIELTLERDNI